MSVHVESRGGPRLTAGLGELSALRLRVFSDWPYLYDGDADYEADYLHTFAAADGAVSVLPPEYRGQGIGHAFFDHRETHGRRLNAAGAAFRHVTFCGVVRSDTDPRKPPGYRPLDDFWRKRGYQPVPGMTGNYDWREIGAQEETPHTMQFWLKSL